MLYPTLRSSLGFHTITLSMWLFPGDILQLLSDFKKYGQETESIQIYPNERQDIVIRFSLQDKGIRWLIHKDVYLERLRGCVDILDVTINPKILSGTSDYITAAEYSDLNVAITNFNRICKNISPILRDFKRYSLKRIDYCINFSLNELVPGCTAERVIDLIKRADIPPHYKEWETYDSTGHRMKSRPGSFYLMCKSVNINCYSKYMKLLDQSQKNIERGYPPVPQWTMEASRDIIRFEIQCKYHNVYVRSKKAKLSGNRSVNKYKDLLSKQVCEHIIRDYFNKTIGKGDWYTLQGAIQEVNSHHFNRQKANRLIDTLREVNQCRSLADAKSAHQGSDLDAFKRTIYDLSGIGINPVTIPKEWGIRYIPNLLRAYDSKAAELSAQLLAELTASENLHYRK